MARDRADDPRRRPLATMNLPHVDIREKRFGENVILADIAFALTPGERVASLGPSGAGKSALLALIAGIETDFMGTITSAARRATMAFQTPRLLPWRTLAENVALSPLSSGLADARARLAALGMADAADLHPERASLGMQRRASLARAGRARRPRLTGRTLRASLDADAAARAREATLRALETTSAAAVLATHDPIDALTLCDRVITLDGRPTRLAADRRSPLSRSERSDPARVAACAAQFRPHHPR